MTKLRILIFGLSLASTVGIYSSEEATAASSEPSYDDVLKSDSGFRTCASKTTEIESAFIKGNEIIIFDKDGNYLRREQVGAKIRKKNKQSISPVKRAPAKKEEPRVEKKAERVTKVAEHQPASQSAAASATESTTAPTADKPVTPKLTVETGNGKTAKEIVTTPVNNNGKTADADKPKRQRSIIARYIKNYYKHALVGVCALGVLWKIRSSIEKRRIEREKAPAA